MDLQPHSLMVLLALLAAVSVPSPQADTVLWHSRDGAVDVTACARALPAQAVEWAAASPAPVRLLITAGHVDQWKGAGAFEVRYSEPQTWDGRFGGLGVLRVMLPAAGSLKALGPEPRLILLLATDGDFVSPPLEIRPPGDALRALLACRP